MFDDGVIAQLFFDGVGDGEPVAQHPAGQGSGVKVHGFWRRHSKSGVTRQSVSRATCSVPRTFAAFNVDVPVSRNTRCEKKLMQKVRWNTPPRRFTSLRARTSHRERTTRAMEVEYEEYASTSTSKHHGWKLEVSRQHRERRELEDIEVRVETSRSLGCYVAYGASPSRRRPRPRPRGPIVAHVPRLARRNVSRECTRA